MGDKHYDHRQPGEGKVQFSLQPAGHPPLPREVRAGPQTGQKSRGKGWCKGHGGMLLTSSILITFTLSSYNTQQHQPRSGTAQSKLDPPVSSSNQENALQACPQANLVGALYRVDIKLVNVPGKYTTWVWIHSIRVKARCSRAYRWSQCCEREPGDPPKLTGQRVKPTVRGWFSERPWVKREK